MLIEFLRELFSLWVVCYFTTWLFTWLITWLQPRVPDPQPYIMVHEIYDDCVIEYTYPRRSPVDRGH